MGGGVWWKYGEARSQVLCRLTTDCIIAPRKCWIWQTWWVNDILLLVIVRKSDVNWTWLQDHVPKWHQSSQWRSNEACQGPPTSLVAITVFLLTFTIYMQYYLLTLGGTLSAGIGQWQKKKHTLMLLEHRLYRNMDHVDVQLTCGNWGGFAESCYVIYTLQHQIISGAGSSQPLPLLLSVVICLMAVFTVWLSSTSLSYSKQPVKTED